jgi:serine/threonine protein kinase
VPEEKIIHYDVKASNVLLDDYLTPKLTDFGLAQLLSRADAHASVHVPRGTVGYMAREVIDINVEMAAITEKCDVYNITSA